MKAASKWAKSGGAFFNAEKSEHLSITGNANNSSFHRKDTGAVIRGRCTCKGTRESGFDDHGLLGFCRGNTTPDITAAAPEESGIGDFQPTTGTFLPRDALPKVTKFLLFFPVTLDKKNSQDDLRYIFFQTPCYC